MRIKKIVFDFDGVLTKGGEPLKEQAWDFMADLWSGQAKKWLGEARLKFGQGKGSRFDILKYVILRFGHTEAFDDVLVPAYAECYDQIVQRLLVDSGLAEHAEELLDSLQTFRFELYVNSATPTPGLLKSLQALRIDDYFEKILGWPNRKLENLRIVRSSTPAAEPKEIVFVGDGENDWKAAKDFGCHFVGMANSWNNWGERRPKGMPKYCLISDLQEIPKKIALFEKK
ncbi:MAG: HAD family hydrolase [Candidatus Paceibacterota bacterium]|jgi:phosphoglycolate phosphatase-like HAD superfamily hydrolase